MDIKISSKHLALLALLISSGTTANGHINSLHNTETLHEAAQLIREMESVGILRVDPKTGKIMVIKDLLEILKMGDKASASDTVETADGTGRTGTWSTKGK